MIAERASQYMRVKGRTGSDLDIGAFLLVALTLLPEILVDLLRDALSLGFVLQTNNALRFCLGDGGLHGRGDGVILAVQGGGAHCECGSE